MTLKRLGNILLIISGGFFMVSIYYIYMVVFNFGFNNSLAMTYSQTGFNYLLISSIFLLPACFITGLCHSIEESEKEKKAEAEKEAEEKRKAEERAAELEKFQNAELYAAQLKAELIDVSNVLIETQIEVKNLKNDLAEANFNLRYAQVKQAQLEQELQKEEEFNNWLVTENEMKS